MNFRAHKAVLILLPIVAVAIAMAVGFDAGRQRRGESTADEGPPPENIAEMVHHSSVIVVAHYESITDLGTFLMFTPDPREPTAAPGMIGPPVPEYDLIGTRVIVSRVLKGGDSIVATQPITYVIAGEVPESRAELRRDAASMWPDSWPASTEFVLFLDSYSRGDEFVLPFGVCGRVLTSGTEVTCSDGDRTVLDFMSGIGRDEFIAAIEAEVADPSPTRTPYPWPTLTAEPPEPTP